MEQQSQEIDCSSTQQQEQDSQEIDYPSTQQQTEDIDDNYGEESAEEDVEEKIDQRLYDLTLKRLTRSPASHNCCLAAVLYALDLGDVELNDLLQHVETNHEHKVHKIPKKLQTVMETHDVRLQEIRAFLTWVKQQTNK
jgi:hypothetical protein